MNNCILKTTESLVKNLGYFEFYQIKQNRLEKTEVHRFERLWRWIGHFLGFCDSTTSKCHRVSLDTLEKMTYLKERPHIQDKLQINASELENLEDLWVGAKVARALKSDRLVSVVEEIGWKSFFSWATHWKEEKIFEQFVKEEPPADSIDTPYELLNEVSLTAGSIASKKHPCIHYSQHKKFASVIASLPLNEQQRFCKKVDGKTLTFDCKKSHLKWPQDVSNPSFETIKTAFQLSLINIQSLEVDVDALQESAQITALIKLLQKQIYLKKIEFVSSDPSKEKVLPLELANQLAHLCLVDGLDKLDLGPFIWPLPFSKLPATWNVSQATSRPFPQNKPQPLPLTFEEMTSISPFCPIVEFKTADQSYCVPEGVLRRISFHYHHFFMIDPSNQWVTTIESEKAFQIFELVQASLCGFNGIFQSDFDDLMALSIELQMPRAFIKLQETVSNSYVDLERLFPEKPPEHTDIFSDLCLDLHGSELEIDLYHLAQKAPSRTNCLKEYPRHQTISPEADNQINTADLRTYFEGKPLLLTARNLSSFWAIAISFKDGPLFEQIGSWLQSQNLRQIKALYPQYLDNWFALALDSTLCEPLIYMLEPYMTELI